MTETIDTANLRALAAAATPGPWTFIRHTGPSAMGEHSASDDWTVFGPGEKQICYEGGAPALADPEYIAAANPATIIALLDRLAAAEARNATLTDDAARDRVNAARYAWVKANLQGLDEGDFEGAIKSADDWEKFIDGLIDDAAIQARAAASISTKGDGHG